MCSIVEDDFGDDGGVHAMIEDVKVNGAANDSCKKCNTFENILGQSGMCCDCFNQYARHKFKATLGSSKVVNRRANVLMNFTGDPANISLLDMVRFAFEREAKYKRLCFEMDLVFIDENCVNRLVGQDPQSRLKKIQDVCNLLEQFPNFKCYYTSIGSNSTADLPEIGKVTMENVTSMIENEKGFLEKLSSLKSGLTSRQDLIAVKRTEILRSSAESTNCQYVFLSDITVTLASRLLTNMSLGRGSSVAFDVAFCEDRNGTIKFIRPLKDLNDSDVKYYVQCNNLECFDNKSYGEDDGQFASIQNLTSKFVNDLQKNFSSTVSTVYRVCNKIAPIEEAEPTENKPSNTERCTMCKAFLDDNSETLFAISMSRYVSESVGIKDYQQDAVSKIETSPSGARSRLCHGCRNIFIGLSDDDLKEFF